MPNPQEVCTIRADGQSYNIWETVEVHRAVQSVQGTINHALMTVSEISGGGAGFSNLKLTVGDVVGIDLAGINVIDGLVYLRQAAYDDKTHAVQIGVASRTEAVVRTTVDVKPGSYPNQTIQQIGSACFGAVGCSFTVAGSPSGADQPFKRATEQLGESRFNFIERLCRMVNLHMLDDGMGGMIAFRGTQGSGGLTLQEGVNILRARLLLQIDEYVETIGARAQDHNADSGASSAQVEADATGTSPGKETGGSVVFGAEESLASGMLQLRANHQADYNNARTVEGTITVQGWFAPDGQLWWFKVTGPATEITINSPMLIPQGSATFLIREVVMKQSSAEGTTTDIHITNLKGMGSNEGFGTK